MADWPFGPVLPDGNGTISPFGTESLGSVGSVGAGASATWLNANLAIFIPFRISRTIIPTYGFVLNGSAVAGNWQVGVYDTNGMLICATVSSAQTTVSSISSAVLFTATVSSPSIGPGVFYMAISLTNSTGTIYKAATPGATMMRIMGCAHMQTAAPLPATATFATISSGFFPYFGITVRSFV